MANKMKNILVTGFDGSDEDVMIFTETLTVEGVEAKLKLSGHTFNEIYEVAKSDLQFYMYEPCWIEE